MTSKCDFIEKEETGKLELSQEYQNIQEIPDYGFSGREDLEEIVLPESVKRIGRYAFYNCRNLRKITFYSNIQDVGSGAFTGCHQVRHLDLTILNGETSCLKDFLQELTEEMLVEYRVMENSETGYRETGYARLMFPEYFEEGVENTPARILMTQIHGSGLKYRNCFYKKEFLFEEYDVRFPYAEAVESEGFLQKMVVGRLMFPYRLSEKGKKQYETYLREHLTKTGQNMIEKRDATQLVWLLEHYLETKMQAEELLEVSGRQGVPECTACLMEWKKRKFGKVISRGVPDFDF